MAPDTPEAAAPPVEARLGRALDGIPFLDDATRKRLLRLAGRRADQQGVITIVAREMRSQLRNRELARQRLAELIERASHPPRPRIPTAPSRTQRRKRLDSKRRRGERKQMRKPPGSAD